MAAAAAAAASKQGVFRVFVCVVYEEKGGRGQCSGQDTQLFERFHLIHGKGKRREEKGRQDGELLPPFFCIDGGIGDEHPTTNIP